MIGYFSRRIKAYSMLFGFVTCAALTPSISAAETAKDDAKTALNPLFFYYYNGELVGNRSFSVSDPDNWGGVQAKNLTATSTGSKVSISPTNYRGEGDAILVEWSRKKKKGQLTLGGGAPVDISAAKDAAALTFDIRIDTMSKKPVMVGMDCGYPCRAELNISKQLRSYPKKEWFTFPIPLNCFTSDDFDLSKITGPLMLSTEGKMTAAIANVRLERLPPGETGCAE